MKLSGWITGIGLVLCVPPGAHAQQRSASITLLGYVPETSTVTLQDVNPVISPDIRTPVHDALVARVLEQSNARAGYTITVTSENARQGRQAALLDTQKGTFLPYHLSYGGTGLQFVNGAASLVRRERTRGHPRRNELRITTPGNGRLPAGEYSDTITISITAR